MRAGPENRGEVMGIPNVFQTYSKRIPTRYPADGVARSPRKRKSALLTLSGLTRHLLPLLLVAAPASAAGKFQLPEGCEAFVTVQHSDCQVSQHYTCSGDKPGDQWSAYLSPDGPFYLSRIDAETRWMESHDLITPDSDQLATEANPASFSTLLETGRDDFDFTTESAAGEVRRYVGFDKLAGGKVTIDGVTLERTEFALETFAADGSFLHRRTGQQVISRDWRLFFSDAEHFENAYGDQEDSVSRPMTFAFPGEKGFLATAPQFGCDQMMTQVGATQGVIHVRY
jgi:hypothetical protein